MKLSLADDDGASADLGGGERSLRDDQLQGDLARPAHLVALLDDERMLAIAEGLELHEGAHKGRDGRASRRILAHAEAWREHAGVEMVLRPDRLARVDIGARVTAVAENLGESLAVRLRSGDRLEGADRHEIVVDP